MELKSISFSLVASIATHKQAYFDLRYFMYRNKQASIHFDETNHLICYSLSNL